VNEDKSEDVAEEMRDEIDDSGDRVSEEIVSIDSRLSSSSFPYVVELVSCVIDEMDSGAVAAIMSSIADNDIDINGAVGVVCANENSVVGVEGSGAVSIMRKASSACSAAFESTPTHNNIVRMPFS